jgi:hypothetical protein
MAQKTGGGTGAMVKKCKLFEDRLSLKVDTVSSMTITKTAIKSINNRPNVDIM